MTMIPHESVRYGKLFNYTKFPFLRQEFSYGIQYPNILRAKSNNNLYTLAVQVIAQCTILLAIRETVHIFLLFISCVKKYQYHILKQPAYALCTHTHFHIINSHQTTMYAYEYRLIEHMRQIFANTTTWKNAQTTLYIQSMF